MRIIRSNILLIIVLGIILIFVQLLRMDILLDADSSENIVFHEYDFVNSKKMTEIEKRYFDKKSYLILYDDNNDFSLDNIKSVLDYLKVDYETAATNQVLELSNYETVILLEHTQNVNINNLGIFNYVRNGGKLLYLSNGSLGDKDLLIANGNDFGIKNTYDSKDSNFVYFNSEVLLGLTGELDLADNQFEDYNNFTYLEVELERDAIIHMEENSGSPLIWEKTLGQGKIMVVNIGNYNAKENRALILGSFTLLQDLIVYPIINSEVIFIDDFPADYKSEHKIIRDNYGRDFERFIKEIWWPDMVVLMKRLNLRYTTAYIQTYNDEVNGPFKYNDATDSTTKELIREVLKYEGETSFHGYNHQSLLYKQSSADKIGYNPWPGEDKIIESVGQSLSAFKELYPRYNFHTYVPPSNLLDDEAIPALLKAIPTLRTISGLYYGELYDDGTVNKDIMEQDIGVNHYGIVDLPRITSGSFLNDNVKYRFASLITTHGLVNHFIHPDDILDPDRSLNMLWNELFIETDRLFSYINETYKWIEKDTASNASEKVRQYTHTRTYYREYGKQIQIAVDNFDNEISLILKTEREIVFGTGCSFKKIGANRYLVTMYESKGHLEVR